MTTFAQRVKSSRIKNGYSQEGLVKIMNEVHPELPPSITRTAISQWENNVTHDITALNLLRFCEATCTEPYWLIFGK